MEINALHKEIMGLPDYFMINTLIQESQAWIIQAKL